MKKLIVIVLILAAGCGRFLLPEEKGKEKLDTVTKQIDDINDKLESLKTKENSILNDIYKVELLMEKAIIENNRIKMQVKATEEKINKRNVEKKQLEDDIRQSKGNLQKILRLLYKIGTNAYLKLFVQVENFDQFFRNYRNFTELINYKSNEINKLKTSMLRLTEVNKELQAEYTTLRSLQQQKEQKVQETRSIKQSKMELIRKINNDKEQYLRMLDELEAEAGQLNQLIYGKPLKRRLGLIDLASIQGKLKWPLKGTIISFFGKKKSTKFDTYIINNGIKIRPGASDQVKAVYPGEVAFADYYKGYGNLIIIQHAKNLYTLYGHCDKMFKAAGDDVSEGELIGMAGDTGSTTGKALYFEIRTHLRPQDPLAWLTKKQ